ANQRIIQRAIQIGPRLDPAKLPVLPPLRKPDAADHPDSDGEAENDSFGGWRPEPELLSGGPADPVRELGLPGDAPRSLSTDEVQVVRAHAAARLRTLNHALTRAGMPTIERARIVWDLRNAVVIWTRNLLRDPMAAERRGKPERTTSFAEFVAK